MHKIIAVAKAEYRIAIRSKAFIIGVLMTPFFMLVGVGAQLLVQKQVDRTERRAVIVDPAGVFFPLIESANAWRDANEVYQVDKDGPRSQTRPHFRFERYEGSMEPAQLHAALGARVESGELIGYAIIGSAILDTNPPETGTSQPALAYHTNTPSDVELSNWLEYVVNRETHRLRFEKAGLDQAQVRELSKNVRLESMALVKPSAEGDEAAQAERNNEARTFAIPVAAMGFIFLVVMMTAPALLNQVLEEKIQKISEVLVASVTPFQLMMGKLLGTVWVALTLAVGYMAAIYVVTLHFGVSDLIDPMLYPWIFLFLVLALLIYGSVFSAIGAACNEIKDAQSLMTPAMLIMVIPFFAFGLILRSPNSPLAAALSLFPPATPMLMMLRIALNPGPPLWQLLLGVGLTLGFTVLCVAAAGKVFRIGILSQGQTPTLLKIVRWIVSR